MRYLHTLDPEEIQELFRGNDDDESTWKFWNAKHANEYANGNARWKCIYEYE